MTGPKHTKRNLNITFTQLESELHQNVQVYGLLQKSCMHLFETPSCKTAYRNAHTCSTYVRTKPNTNVQCVHCFLPKVSQINLVSASQKHVSFQQVFKINIAKKRKYNTRTRKVKNLKFRKEICTQTHVKIFLFVQREFG